MTVLEKEALEKVMKLINKFDIDLIEVIEPILQEAIENRDSSLIDDEIQESNMLDVDVIYYNNAMKYLLENDPSMTRSIEIAQEMGYNISDINSELLASLLASEEKKEAWDEVLSEIDEIINDID